MNLLAWGLVAATAVGMMAGAVRPPERNAGLWLACLCFIGAVGFVWLDGDGMTLAFFSVIGTWLGAQLTGNKGGRLHFRGGALGWGTGVCFALWWLWEPASLFFS